MNWLHGIGVFARLRLSERKSGVSSSTSTCRAVMAGVTGVMKGEEGGILVERGQV